jgi:transposase InsO family protein
MEKGILGKPRLLSTRAATARGRPADGDLAATSSRGKTICHTDHGSQAGQYTSWAFGGPLWAAGLLGSMQLAFAIFD